MFSRRSLATAAAAALASATGAEVSRNGKR